MLFLNQRKRNNGHRNILITKSSRKNVLDVGFDRSLAAVEDGFMGQGGGGVGLERIEILYLDI